MNVRPLGDKIIVTTFALRAAALLRRVLYIDWPSPCGVQAYLRPVCRARSGPLGRSARSGAGPGSLGPLVYGPPLGGMTYSLCHAMYMYA